MTALMKIVLTSLSRALHRPDCRRLAPVALMLSLLTPVNVVADTVLAAVAANFAPAMRELVSVFEAQGEDNVRIATGSTGKLFAQIRNGAPFDIFFAADQATPAALHAEGLTSGSAITYATGRLVLYGGDQRTGSELEQQLRAGNYDRLAIANPRLAPYGRAAQQALGALGLDDARAGKLLMGENVVQAFQFVYTGNADLALIARSQLSVGLDPGTYWLLPQHLHEPVEQDMVVLRSNNAGAQRLAAFMRSAAALRVMRFYGYEVAESQDDAT